MNVRVGLGYDVHPFAEGRSLVLGGVRLEHARGLAGHSDADALCHAVADALLGAAGLGDLGAHFPASDLKWRGADSLALLSTCAAKVEAAGWRPVQADAVVACEAPALAPHIPQMEANLSRALSGAAISVKAKAGEGIGFVGRAEGVAAFAVVLLERRRGTAKRPEGIRGKTRKGRGWPRKRRKGKTSTR